MKEIFIFACVRVSVCVSYKTVTLPAMDTEGEGVVESGLEESVREGVVDGA